MTDKHTPIDPNLAHFTTFALANGIGQDLRREAAYSTGKNARCLVRSAELTLVVTALAEGSELKSHHAPGSATAIVLEGEVAFRTLGEHPSETVLRQHDCAVFSPKVQHSVEAKKETLLLIVIGHKKSD